MKHTSGTIFAVCGSSSLNQAPPVRLALLEVLHYQMHVDGVLDDREEAVIDDLCSRLGLEELKQLLELPCVPRPALLREKVARGRGQPHPASDPLAAALDECVGDRGNVIRDRAQRRQLDRIAKHPVAQLLIDPVDGGE